LETSDQLTALGTAIAPLLETEVSEVVVVAEVHDDWLDIRFNLVRGGEVVQGVDGGAEMSNAVADALLTIRDDMMQAGQEDWHHCNYVLRSDGSFKFDIDRDRPPSV